MKTYIHKKPYTRMFNISCIHHSPKLEETHMSIKREINI